MSKEPKKVNPEEVFPEVETMLYQLAWNHSRRFGQDFEDCRSQAYMGFMKACNNYRSGKGTKFSSWCYMVVFYYLKSDIMSLTKKHVPTVEINEELAGFQPDPVPVHLLRIADSLPRHCSLGRTLLQLFQESPRQLIEVTEGLSKDGETLFHLLIETSEEMGANRKEQIERVFELLAGQIGEARTKRAYREIKVRLVEAWT